MLLTAANPQVVLVTGATRGIGSAIARQFQEHGAELLLTGTNADEIQRLNAAKPVGVRYLQVDFSGHASTEEFCKTIEALPRLDVCVNNAGINIIRPFGDVTAADFDRLNAIDYRAPYLVGQAAAKVMKRAGRGWIVNIASIWSVITKPQRTLYTAAKSGLAGLTRAMAVELGGHGILVNSVSPGFVETDLTRQSLSDAERGSLSRQVPLGRMAQPEEIARVVTFLASEQNTYLTGQNIIVDGGFTNV